jgi:hypothetical protein
MQTTEHDVKGTPQPKNTQKEVEAQRVQDGDRQDLLRAGMISRGDQFFTSPILSGALEVHNRHHANAMKCSLG